MAGVTTTAAAALLGVGVVDMGVEGAATSDSTAPTRAAVFFLGGIGWGWLMVRGIITNHMLCTYACKYLILSVYGHTHIQMNEDINK